MLRKTTARVLIPALFLLVFAALIFWTLPGAVWAAPVAGQTLEARRVTSPLTVDGDLSDWPSASSLYLDAATAQYVAGRVRDNLDLSASISSSWDDTYLYIAAVITDDILIADSSNIWDDDSIELAFDGERDGRCCGTDDHQFTAAIDGRLADFGTLVGQTSLARVAVRQRSGGYSVELAIPLTSLTGRPVLSGTVMGINLGLNDDDDGGRRDKRIVWVGNTTLDFTNLGALVFTGQGPALPTATPTVAGASTATPVATATPTSATAATATPASQPSPTATRTVMPTVTATPTASNQPTPSADQRLATLESNIVTLEGRIRSVLDVLQSAGRLPATAKAAIAGQKSASAADVADPRAYVQGVNCGGAAYTTVIGDFYAADQAYSTEATWGHLGGQVAQIANAITNTSDPTLYQSERYNFPGYNFDVPAGKYAVMLRFAETYQYARSRGRIFDVKIEDQIVADDLDILGQAGHFVALDLTFTVIVTDGQLNVSFAPSVGAATINAIFVRGVDYAGPTPTPSSTDRVGTISSKLSELETLLNAILDIFRATQPGQPTVTPTLTPTSSTSSPTRTATSAAATATATRTAPTSTRTITLTPTRTATPGGPVETPHTSAKKGVGGGERPELLRQVGVSWSYAWYYGVNNWNGVYEHVPMIFGATYEASTLITVARAHPGSYWLLWNEPDYWQQGNISPLQAAQIYRTLRPVIIGADPTAKLIVGGVYNLNLAWIASFRSEYLRLYGEYPVVEGWHVHLYVGRTEYNIATWRSKMQAVRDWMPANGGMVELWLTEFGCLDSDTVAQQIMEDQVPWMEAQPWITRYAWFAAFSSGTGCPNCTGSLFNADDSLTTLGNLYRRLP